MASVGGTASFITSMMWSVMLPLLLRLTQAGGLQFDCDNQPSIAKNWVFRQKNRCYAWNSVAQSFELHAQTCASAAFGHGTLAMAKTPEQLQMLLKLQNVSQAANGYWQSAFIGLQQNSTEDEPKGNWFWVDGTPYDSSLVVYNLLDNDQTEQCAAVYRSPAHATPQPYQTQGDVSCANRQAICELPTYQPSPMEVAATDPVRMTCIETGINGDKERALGGLVLGSSCFFLVMGEGVLLTWTDCWTRVEAVDSKARLAHIYTQEIADRLTNLMVSTWWVHTGLRYDADLGEWRWMNTADGQSDPGGRIDIRPKITGMSNLENAPRTAAFRGSGSYGQLTNVDYALACLGEIGSFGWLFHIHTHYVSPYQKYEIMHEGRQLSPTNEASTLASTVVVADERECAFECQKLTGCLAFNYNHADKSCQALALKSAAVPDMAAWTDDADWSYFERVY